MFPGGLEPFFLWALIKQANKLVFRSLCGKAFGFQSLLDALDPHTLTVPAPVAFEGGPPCSSQADLATAVFSLLAEELAFHWSPWDIQLGTTMGSG